MIDPATVTWLLAEQPREIIQHRRNRMGAEAYASDVEALRILLCSYFVHDDGCCLRKMGSTITPVGPAELFTTIATETGEKLLKVRWGGLACGRSGGLRLYLAVNCDACRVRILEAHHRRDL